MTELLNVRNLTARHGQLPAVREVSLTIGRGEVLALVGANGAGKSTLLRAIAGVHPIGGGTVHFDGSDITRLPADRRVAAGIALVPEGRRLFPEMTVEENLRVARSRPGGWELEMVLEAFPMLRQALRRRASTLSGGEQQSTAIARALLTNPRLLLIDEVSLGLSPVATEAVYKSLDRLIRAGTTLVLVEQDLGRAMSVADRIVCLRDGRVALTAHAGAVTREEVTEAYFGLGKPTAVRS
ncbi:ABC transporter ATP-binding protein [Rhizocola hellebori]|uniref:ABC transporter ATP-binding protein n=1 Tax=Rhizocola hellebori TaxID=1392758 RepID=A0A8J3Q8S8_9ACTN|nr:ABC transporter ATP-binding protein [Rhizocola hellebori]GIH05180.1 ABC transporter ATP-binding protein [Rhizocola hellebori]